jgi:oligopeptide transport system substrate-binding protein
LKEAGDLERAARTLMKLGLTYHTAFDFKAARQTYEEGFALWQRAGEVEPAVSLPPAPHALRVAGDTLHAMGLSADIGSADPAHGIGIWLAVVIGQLFCGLVEESSEMEVVPDVARSWEVLDGGRKYVFHLRDDAVWSDGMPVTAGDFEYAWKRGLDPVTRLPAANQLYDIKGAKAFHQGEGRREDVGVRALDEVTLVVELEEPTGHFLYLLANVTAYPVPRHVVEAHGEAWAEAENIATNGPFRLDAWQRGESMVLVRNPEYHGRFKGNMQRVELSFLAGWPDILEKYEADSLDTANITYFPVVEVDRARQRYAGEYLSRPLLTAVYVGFDVRQPPFDDVRVRRAFVHATDRETLADVGMRGCFVPATGGFIPAGMPGHSPGIGLPYDPERARQLLAEAGYPEGRGFPSVEALVPPVGLESESSKYLRAQWRENLGIEVLWEQMDWAMFWERKRKQTPHMFRFGLYANYPDPDCFLRQYFHWPPIGFMTGWRNELYEGLVGEARRVTNQGERMQLYGQADRMIVEEAPVLPLFHWRLHLLVKPWVKTYPTSSIGRALWKDVIIEPH